MVFRACRSGKSTLDTLRETRLASSRPATTSRRSQRRSLLRTATSASVGNSASLCECPVASGRPASASALTSCLLLSQGIYHLRGGRSHHDVRQRQGHVHRWSSSAWGWYALPWGRRAFHDLGARGATLASHRRRPLPLLVLHWSTLLQLALLRNDHGKRRWRVSLIPSSSVP